MTTRAFLRANIGLLLSLLLTAAVVTFFMVVGPIGGGPTVSYGYHLGAIYETTYVNDSAGSDTNECNSAGTPCKTIAEAINQTSSGGTVNVDTGVYEETVSITRPLTLQGVGDTSTIQAASGNSVEVRVSDVTINNLKIVGASDGAAIRFLGNVVHDGITISNNTFDCEGTNCFSTCGTTTVCPSTTSLTVTGNTFSNWGTRAVRIGDEVTSVTDFSSNSFLKTGTSVVAVTNFANALTLNATNNFWGKASGPGGIGNGDGGNIVQNTGTVTFRPWLLVQDGGTFDETIVLKTSPGDWTLFSAPQLLSATPTVADDAAGTVSMLAYVGGGFITPGSALFDADVVKPVSAFFVKATSKAGIGFNYDLPTSPALTSKQLTAGWNLVGTNNTALAEDELSSIQSTPFASGLVTLFVPDTFNDSARKDKGHIDWTADGDRDLNANPITGLPSKSLSDLDGYWAFLNSTRDFSKQVIVQ